LCLANFVGFSEKQLNGESILKLLQPLGRAGNVKVRADPRSSWMTNLGCSGFTDEEGNAISNLITEQVDSVTE
jgi:hypothetical protein